MQKLKIEKEELVTGVGIYLIFGNTFKLNSLNVDYNS